MYSDSTYITSNGVIGEPTLAGLADKVNSPGSIAAQATIDNINGAIQRADALIDSYIRSVYNGVLPLATVPETIKSASAEIAGYLLWQSTNVPHEENPLADKYDAWLKWLTQLAKGIVVLDLGDYETDRPTLTRTGRTYADRQFTPEKLGEVF